MRFISQPRFFKHKQVLLRLDLNVGTKAGQVVDDFRIVRALPTINWLRRSCSKLILLSHLGDPSKPSPSFSLAPVARYLSAKLNTQVFFVNTDLKAAREVIAALPEKSVVLLENLRFHQGEKQNSAVFARELAALGEVYVNDAFGESHRQVASIDKIKSYLPYWGGLLLKQETENLDRLLAARKSPRVVILGGAKLRTKLPLIKRFSRQADYILLGGGLANTFLKAKGIKIGSSLFEPKFVPEAKKLLRLPNLVLPQDWSVANLKTSSAFKVLSGDLSSKQLILDLGPASSLNFVKLINRAGTILWNGPLGYFENSVFSRGSQAVLRAVLANRKAYRVIGGGETLQLVANRLGSQTKSKNLFLSTGGGALLEYLSGKKLPGLTQARVKKLS